MLHEFLGSVIQLSQQLKDPQNRRISIHLFPLRKSIQASISVGEKVLRVKKFVLGIPNSISFVRCVSLLFYVVQLCSTCLRMRLSSM